MQISLSFTRILFLGLCLLFATSYSMAIWPEQSYVVRGLAGVVVGICFGLLIISLDAVFKRFNLRAFNIAALGLLFGCLMGEAIMLAFEALVNAVSLDIPPLAMGMLRTGVFLMVVYLGMVMTIRASDELYVSIPFIKFKPSSQKKKDLILDLSIMLDPRLIDLASSGLLDHHLIIPRFLIKECYEMSESAEETTRSRARRILEVIKKLEGIPTLNLRYTDADFPEHKDQLSKLIRLARLLEANILSADSSRVQHSNFEGVLIINIHTLSAALKPIAQAGEFISIKIQRYGKEARQGVGYLEDGTMVVVNGGSEFIGETVKAQVLSVKHTSSGRMIFSNVLEAEQDALSSLGSCDSLSAECEHASVKNYFAL
jgi:uncharacterized protein YacL